MLEIEITEDVRIGAAVKKAAGKSAKAAAELENKEGSVSLLFTDDDNIRRLNKQYRGKDAVTDVLSFPSGEEGFLGDIAISLPRAFKQAKEYGHSEEREVAFLTAHSMLHLFGYGHDSEKEEQIMREKQREIIKKAGYEL
jgi:probable rRNA maturation factor